LLLSRQEEGILASAARINVKQEIEKSISFEVVPDVECQKLSVTNHWTVSNECGLLKRAD